MDIKWYYYLIICAVGYLIGSINFAKILSRFKKKNILEVGSGNPGTMNMLRGVGLYIGLFTLLLDILKGVAVTLLGLLLAGDLGAAVGGFCVVFGHIYSCFMKFRGGKGVACFIGVYFVIEPIAAAVGLVLLVGFLFLFKYGFVGSFLLTFGLTLTHCLIHASQPSVIAVSVLTAFLVIFAHRENIIRLFKGQENKLDLFKVIADSKKKKDAAKAEQENETEQ